MAEHQLRKRFQVDSITVAESDTNDLFQQTLQGDYENDAPLEAVWKLCRLGTRDVFEYAADWCRSEDPLRRARGCDVLS